jgi:hypothetical protein
VASAAGAIITASETATTAEGPLPASIMLVRFDIREDPHGWTIYDRLTNEPAVVGLRVHRCRLQGLIFGTFSTS